MSELSVLICDNLSEIDKLIEDKEYASTLELLDALLEMSKTKFIRHKTKHTKFRIVVPLWIVIGIVIVAVFYLMSLVSTKKLDGLNLNV